jgi:hypothetical protein
MSGSVREGDRQAVMRENQISKEVAVDSNRESKGEDDREDTGNQRGVRGGTGRGRVTMLRRDEELSFNTQSIVARPDSGHQTGSGTQQNPGSDRRGPLSFCVS